MLFFPEIYCYDAVNVTQTKPKVPVIAYQPCNMNSMMPVGNMYGGRHQFGMPPMNMMHSPRSVKFSLNLVIADSYTCSDPFSVGL